MHDFSLGGPVRLDCYCGPLLNNQPLHKGACEDGVHGCRACNEAARRLSDEQLKAIGWSLTSECEYCHKTVSVRDVRGLRPVDEPSCYYEVCGACRKEHDDQVQRDTEPEECWCCSHVSTVEYRGIGLCRKHNTPEFQREIDECYYGDG